LRIVPIVKDAGKEIQLAAPRHGGEHVAAHRGAPLGDAFGREECRRTLDDARQVVERGAEMRMCLEERGEQLALAAANVDDVLDTGEVVGFGDHGARQRREPAHRVVEELRQPFVLLQIGEEGGLAMEQLKRAVAGRDAVAELRRRLPEGLASEQEGERPH
jgi:hypothetical protein